MTASTNVNWEGSSTDIKRHKLITIAVAVNRQFGTTLDYFDIKLTWAKLWTLWETWVCMTHYVHHENVNSTTGTIDINNCTWDQLWRINLIFFSVNATFLSLSVFFLDMFVASLFFFFFFSFFFHVFCSVFMFMPNWKQIQNSYMNPNHII